MKDYIKLAKELLERILGEATSMKVSKASSKFFAYRKSIGKRVSYSSIKSSISKIRKHLNMEAVLAEQWLDAGSKNFVWDPNNDWNGEDNRPGYSVDNEDILIYDGSKDYAIQIIDVGEIADKENITLTAAMVLGIEYAKQVASKFTK